MTVAVRSNAKSKTRVRRRVRRALPKPSSALRQASVTVYLVRPKGTRTAIERGRRLAEQVRRELAAHESGSLDEAMQQLRGRTWSP